MWTGQAVRLTSRGTLFQGQKGLPKNGRFHYLTMTPPLRACFESIYLQRQVEREGSGALPSWTFCSQEGKRSTGTICGPAGGSRSLKPLSSRQSDYTISAGRWCPCSSTKGSRRGRCRAISGIGRW